MIWQPPISRPPSILPYPPFPSKNFQTRPPFHQFWKSWTPLFMRGGAEGEGFELDFWYFTCWLYWNLGSSWECSHLNSFYGYYFGRCLFELAQLVPVPYFRERSTRYSSILYDYSVNIPICYKYTSFFSRTARICNSLLIEYKDW